MNQIRYAANTIASKISVMNDLLWKGRVPDGTSFSECFPENSVKSQDVSIKYKEIPSFLHDSDFYKGLNDEDVSGVIVLPCQYYSTNDEVNDISDITRLLEVLHFWGVHTIPDGFIEFCNNTQKNQDKLMLYLTTALEVGFMSDLKQIFTSDDPLISAVRMGRTEVVRYLAKVGAHRNNPMKLGWTTLTGKLSDVKILRQNGYEWSSAACEAAAMKGDLECLQYLHENGCAWDYKVYMGAIYGKYWDIFEYAYENGLPWHPTVPATLIHYNHLDYLQYAIERGCPLSEESIVTAAQWGTVESLRLILDANCSRSPEACRLASERGHTDCLTLLHQHGFSWDSRATAGAAEGNHLACLQYLHEESCPWNERTTTEAARGCSLDTLRYAFENGCPYHNNFIEVAVLCKSSVECLQFLIEEQGLFMGDEFTFIAAICSCNPVVVQYLIDQGCDIHSPTDITPRSLFFIDQHLKIRREIDEPLLECITIALRYNWDLRNHAPALLRAVVRCSSDVPLLYAYLQNEGYVQKAFPLFNPCSYIIAK